MKQLSLTILDVMNRDKHTIRFSDTDHYSKPKQILFKACYYLGKLLPTSWKVRLYTRVSEKMYLGRKTLYIRSNDQYKGRITLMPVEWMSAYEKLRFGDVEMPVTTHYHEMLVSIYGEDYMTPVKDDRNGQVHDLIRAENEDISL